MFPSIDLRGFCWRSALALLAVLVTVGEPSNSQEKPSIVGNSIAGKWRASNGLDIYIDQPEDQIRVTVVRPNARSLVYFGRFDGRRLDVAYLLRAQDFSSASPPEVVAQLQGRVNNYYVLDLAEEGNELRGRQFGDAWQFDRKNFEILNFQKRRSSGGSQVTWTRQPDAVRVRFTDSNFEQIPVAKLYAIDGPGAGEVWVEATVPPGDTDFDDSVIEELTVRVTSDSDPEGEPVICVETAPASRVFRSAEPVALVKPALTSL